ncbi:MAG: hypothetical protein FWC53_00560 [Firmicutes bacterium]|nr:hypothetical protein [Bacillota bacterium]
MSIIRKGQDKGLFAIVSKNKNKLLQKLIALIMLLIFLLQPIALAVNQTVNMIDD